MRISFKILLVFLAFSITTSCKGIYKKVDAREVPISGPERAKKNVREGRGVGLGQIMKGGKGTTYEFSTSNPMWRATLDILDFIPLSTVDYSGGVIISDWYTDDTNKDKELKITVRFLSNVVQSNSLKVTVGGIDTDTQTTRNIRADTTTIYGDSSTVGGLDTADTTNTQTNTQSFTFQAEFITNTTADTSDTLSDNGLALADTNLTSKELAFNTAPVNGSSIVITLKPTTFGLNTTTTFDDGAGVETTFDTDGTVFTNDLVTFDRKNVQNTQIIMQRSSITDRITHVSKQRELVRTV